MDDGLGKMMGITRALETVSIAVVGALFDLHFGAVKQVNELGVADEKTNCSM